MSLLISFAVLAIIIITTVFARLRSPLRSVPGPFFAKLTDLWYLRTVNRGQFEHENLKLHQKYGPVVRYGPGRVSFSTPTATKIIYGHGTRFAKSSWYSTWTAPVTGPGDSAGQESFPLFADQSITRHSHNRRLFQNTYSLTSLLSYESYVDECADLFCQRLSELSDTGRSIDMAHWFQCYAFDVIGMITYAKRFGFLDAGEDVGGVMDALEQHLFYATAVGIYPSWHSLLYKVKNALAGNKGSGRAYIIHFTLNRIREEMASGKVVPAEKSVVSGAEVGPESFLSKFLANYANDPGRFTRQHMVDGCMANMVAGSDTTAISLSATLYYLLRHPTCLAALKEEITSFEASGRLSKRPTFKETQQMPYLQAAIKEALRLHPATGLPLERVVPDEGAVIDGYSLPAGTVVGVNVWVEHRNKDIFGDDADLFRPERWLTSDAEHLAHLNRHWIPFGLGSRTCIGRHISMLEMTKIIPRVVRDFDFQLDGFDGSGEDQWPAKNYWFVKPTKFHVKVHQQSKA